MNQIINIRAVLKILSNNLYILAGSLVSCLVVALIYGESLTPFALSVAIALFTGVSFSLIGGKLSKSDSISRQDAYISVTLSWFIMSSIGSLPYLLSHEIPLFTDAFFESVSGFTTTGASILPDIESLPKSILFWRSLTHWIGGIGIIVLMLVVMPSLRIGGYHLFTLESSLQEKIQPKIKSVGHRLLLIYLCLTAAEIVLLWLGDMSIFESVCHSFSTIATGGFSPSNTSVANYSPYIQYVISLFMLLAGVNFVVYYHGFKGNFSKVAKNEEMWTYFFIVTLIGSVLTYALYTGMGKPFEESFREAFFQIISIITCTGFASADYLLWPQYAWIIIFFSMFIGGSTGSTAGGIKIARHLVFFKNIRRGFGHQLSRNAVLPIRLNGNAISEKSNNTIMGFIFVYISFFACMSIILIIIGIDWPTASSAVATCMAGIGPGIGSIGPTSNFSHLPDSVKYLLTFTMIVGRLEIFTVMLMFTPSFWKI